jgi:hypothetical protein
LYFHNIRHLNWSAIIKYFVFSCFFFNYSLNIQNAGSSFHNLIKNNYNWHAPFLQMHMRIKIFPFVYGRFFFLFISFFWWSSIDIIAQLKCINKTISKKNNSFSSQLAFKSNDDRSAFSELLWINIFIFSFQFALLLLCIFIEHFLYTIA